MRYLYFNCDQWRSKLITYCCTQYFSEGTEHKHDTRKELQILRTGWHRWFFDIAGLLRSRFWVLPLIRVIVGPLSMATFVDVEDIDIGFVEL